MRANEFIKKFGIEHAKYLLEDTTLEYFAIWSQCAGKSFQDTVCVKDLKRYIDAYELVQSYGGIDAARKEAHKNCFEYDAELLRAITLVEECQ